MPSPMRPCSHTCCCARLLALAVAVRVCSPLPYRSGGRVILTCHGELMWAFRLRLERLTQLRYREMQDDPQIHERIHNCQSNAAQALRLACPRDHPRQPSDPASTPRFALACTRAVLQYTRRDPESGVLYPDFQFMRTVCPWDLSLSNGAQWRKINPSGGLTNEEVLQSVEQYPRLLNDDDGVGLPATPVPTLRFAAPARAPRLTPPRAPLPPARHRLPRPRPTAAPPSRARRPPRPQVGSLPPPVPRP